MKQNMLIVIALSALFVGPMKAQSVKESYVPFAVGEVKPEGWLHDWCGMAARGLTKNLGDNFTEFVKGWESADEKGWWHYEQTGYYIDGVTRLGFIMDDTLLMNRSRRVMEAVVARQKPNGYIMSNNKEYVEKWGTTDGDYGMYWSKAVFGRAALAYYSATGDEKVLQMLENVYDEFPLFDRKGEKYPLSGVELDNMRKIVGLENMLELSRLTGKKLYADRAMQVFKNYESGYLQSWAYDKDFMRSAICHGVTFNENAKLCAAAYTWNANPDYLAASVNAYEFLQQHFVLPHGANSSNEFLHGIGAFEAAEACDVSDFLWSNIWMARATGDSRYGDRIERDVFNALATSVSAYFDLSVYTNAMNRIPGVHLKIRDDGQYYKVIHDPTCCSANINRALPNYIINMFMHNQQNELMVLGYGPAHLMTKDGRYDIQMVTNYPFGESIVLNINTMPNDEVLKLRMPEWCEQYEVFINGTRMRLAPRDGFFHIAREWQKDDVVELRLKMQPTLVKGTEQFADFNGTQPYWGIMEPASAAYEYSGFVEGGKYGLVTYGPLVFALNLQAKEGNYYELNEERWHEFRYALNAHSLDEVEVNFKDLPAYFRWGMDAAPISIKIKADLIEWEPDKGDPKLPITEPCVKQHDVDLELIPMGFAPYRLAMFPWK